ncbi:MAG TPA: hypothetical protein VD704_10735 [Gaiellaceae bacterium]|nr:hypothetical protein [Gaiellaceae bacterium]
MTASLLAVWTTAGLLSVILPAVASIALITGGVVRKRRSAGREPAGTGAVALGILGLFASAGWLILALYIEAKVR